MRNNSDNSRPAASCPVPRWCERQAQDGARSGAPARLRCGIGLGSGLSCAQPVAHPGPHRSGNPQAQQDRLQQRRRRARQRGADVPPGAWIGADDAARRAVEAELAALAPATAPGPWLAGAACAGSGSSLWFAAEDTPEGAEKAQLATAVCAACPVRAQCLDYALEIGEVTEGIWGGMTPAERQAEQIRRNEAAAAAGKERAA
jgi:WhiB family redox-sensing transcriptional regulator